MFEDFQCQCIYVEITSERVPRSGRVEYRAKLCQICQARGALLRVDGKRGVSFAPDAPRYQRTH